MIRRCEICPRRCGAERTERKGGGYCGAPSAAVVCRAAPHFGEEPCISGTRGSGTVFFAGCNLRCVFCQNREISRGTGAGKTVSAAELRDIVRALESQGVHNINLVTPTHFTDAVIEALSGADLKIPVVWNSSGYERVETLRRLEGLVQIYMPDFKYADPALAARYSAAPDYPSAALAAVREMYRQTGPFELDADGILRRGLLIRHLILPGSPENTLRVMDAVEDHLPADKILFSLMSQYTPVAGADLPPELQRRVSEADYDRCMSYLDFSGIQNGFTQSLSSATEEMIPAFDGTGIPAFGAENETESSK